ncbi:putative acetyltransferase [Novipirellula galeiformis]|uniref:Putative acetyltransferase n=2 Tax=Novipirellula galeiformis TaxID=2528004 RepID=A0A5C6CCQ0_9BACT|nr:putative acetyltransferase [Novipirellula galeiformis]
MLAITPLLLTHQTLGRLAGADASLESHSQLLSLIPGTVGSYLRVAFYRFALEHCAASATIGFGVLFSKTGARVGENVYIGPRCMLGWVDLEADVLLGPAVQIPSGPQTHGIERLDVPVRTQPGSPRRVTIGRDSWIGAGAIVLADVAEQTIVGAGSIVTKPLAARCVAVGNPACPLVERK